MPTLRRQSAPLSPPHVAGLVLVSPSITTRLFSVDNGLTNCQRAPPIEPKHPGEMEVTAARLVGEVCTAPRLVATAVQ
jgi:hypothetical protein